MNIVPSSPTWVISPPVHNLNQTGLGEAQLQTDFSVAIDIYLLLWLHFAIKYMIHGSYSYYCYYDHQNFLTYLLLCGSINKHLVIKTSSISRWQSNMRITDIKCRRHMLISEAATPGRPNRNSYVLNDFMFLILVQVVLIGWLKSPSYPSTCAVLAIAFIFSDYSVYR